MPSNGARTIGAVELLARQCGAALGGRQFALGAVAAHFGVVQRLRPRSCPRRAGFSCAPAGASAWSSAWRGGAHRWLRPTVRLSRIAVSSSLTSTSPRLTGSPFSFSTCSTTADTSARRSALRSGWIEPVMTGPEASASLCTVIKSSGGDQQLARLGVLGLGGGLPSGLAGSLASLPQAARAEAMARTSRVLRSIVRSPGWTADACILYECQM